MPVVEAAVAAGAIVSIDTYKPAVAAAALDAGAAIVNDISGFADPEMAALCAGRGAGVVLMHTITPPKVSLWDDGAYGEQGAADSVVGWLGEGSSGSRPRASPARRSASIPASTSARRRRRASR